MPGSRSSEAPHGARLSVVVPALNEAQALPRLLAQLRAQRNIELQLIVADGGSTDETLARAGAAGAQIARAPAGRARQLNSGARLAHHPYLLFLHADSQLESDLQLAQALGALQDEMSRRGSHRVAGHFALRFEGAQPGHEFFYRYLEGKTRLQRPHTINGDQGLLLARSYFDELGGYDERLPFLEDQRIAARVFESGHWLLLPGVLRTSARRFEAEGPRERYTLMAIMMGLHAAGLEAFFDRAPEVYREQSRSTRLDLGPFIALARRLLRAQGARRQAETLYRIGRFVRGNAWQLAYYRDLRRGDERLRRLAAFDRWLAPLLDNPLGDAAATLAVTAWFYLVLPRRAGRASARP